MLKRRPVQVLHLPIDKRTAIPSAEFVILRFASDASLDVGALAFRVRGGMGSAGAAYAEGSKSERLVELRTKDEKRLGPLRNFIMYLDDRLKLQVNRPATLYSQGREVAKFIDWADKERISFPLASVSAAKGALEAYVAYLRVKVLARKLSPNTATLYQSYVIQFLEDFLDDARTVTHGLNLLQGSLSAVKITEPPSEHDQARVLGLAKCLFDGLGDLVLNNRPYPFQLTVPKWIGAKEDSLWVFPHAKWCMPPWELKVRHKLKVGYWSLDYENGRLAEPKVVEDNYIHFPEKSSKASMARRALGLAEASLQRANSNPKHYCRMDAAMSAHNAFIVLFIANTGLNWATIQEMRWGPGEFEVESGRQGFRTVKHRAKGKVISFEIQGTLVPVFRTFLKLRDFILNGRKFDHLFIGATASAKSIRPLPRTTMRSIVKSMKRIDPKLPKIMSKKWRAGKSDWLIRVTDPATAALILQNSESTVLRSYAAGSYAQHAHEMGLFLSGLEKVVLANGHRSMSEQECTLGVCKSSGSPKAMGPAPVTVDCKTAEGCLYCENFNVHADERDTRKLLSSRYCLQQASKLLGSQERRDSITKPIFERIDSILNEISRHSGDLVVRIREEVERGELDDYWARKLEMLIELGLVSK